ncbi:hypothetical protein MKX03_013315 [Papaver bracteatum]|nr:hypothetical protein MKX03_013315 [Papaver bracteatum]
MIDYTQTDRYLELKAAKERRFQRARERKNSDTEATDDNWIDRYFINLTGRVKDQRKKIIHSRSEIKEPSIDLQSSLKMLLQEAACDADNWTDANIRRSFPALLCQLSPSGLEKYKDNDINIGYLPNTSSFTLASPDDVVSGSLKSGKLPPRILRSLGFVKPCVMVVTDDQYLGGSLSMGKLLRDDGYIADKCYRGSLSLKELSQRICLQSGDDFRREQARLLGSFLDHYIKIQQEQRFVANSFSVHLNQLRKSAFSIPDDGDTHTCPIILPKHTTDYCIWQQMHIFNSLCTMSRESVWLLKKLKDSPFYSPSSIKEFNMIHDFILAFISKFKKSKDLLDQYIHDESFRCYVDPDELVMYTMENLYAFGWFIKDLQEQGVERKSVAETLLGCFVDVVNMSNKQGNPFDMPGNPLLSEAAKKTEAAMKTSELINETVKKLNSVKCSDLYSGGSPLGCMALWRILFESSLINLRLERICENLRETVKLGATDGQLDQIRRSIHELLTVGESVLIEFIAMHKTVAEVTYMLGDAFTTGGAGMNDISDVTHLKDFNFDDFPWDKHSFPPRSDNTKNWRDYSEDVE